MNNKAKLIVTSVVASSMLVVSSAPALAAADSGTKPSFWDKIMLGIGFKKQHTPEKRAERIEAMKTKRAEKLNTRLADAVAAGKLTQEQSDVLKTKLEAIDAIKAQNAGKTKQEKRDAMKSAREDLKNWASQNGITLSDIMPNKGQKPAVN
jgi:hypothetical protein